MRSVKLSAKYQVVIPKDVRKKIRLKIGQKLIVFAKDGVIRFIPDYPIAKLRGFLKEIDISSFREKK